MEKDKESVTKRPVHRSHRKRDSANIRGRYWKTFLKTNDLPFFLILMINQTHDDIS